MNFQRRPILALLILILAVSSKGSSRKRSSESLMHKLNQDRCPVLSQPLASHPGQDLVQVDPHTGRRSFRARIVGIFSCLDADSASNDLTLDFRLAKPAIDLAVEAVNRRYQEMEFNVTYRTAPDVCRHQQAAGHASDEYYVHGANYFVGPGCSESLASVGQLASYWNVPMCSTGYLPEMVTARFQPLTLMQLSLSVGSVGEMLLELFQMYKWRHLVIVTDEKHPLHSLIRDGLLEFFHTLYKSQQNQAMQQTASHLTQFPQLAPNQAVHQQARIQGADKTGRPAYHINITSRNFAYSSQKPMDYQQIILDAASYSRVMLFLARSSTIGKLLEAAHSQGMSKGQFVFIAHELFETQAVEAKKLAPKMVQQQQRSANFTVGETIEIPKGNGNQTNDQLMREIFQPLMTISLRIPVTPEFANFRQEVARLSERHFNYRIEQSSLRALYSLGVAAFIYDCVMLYADKVHFVLNQTQFGRINGKTIFELSADSTFSGALTGNLTINKAGQRVIDFTLNDFSPATLKLEPIAHFMAMENRLQFLAGKQIHWARRNQSAPRSDPRCRLSDLFCRYSDDDDLQMSDPSLLGQTGAGYAAIAAQDRFVLGVWLLVAVILSVAFTSSAIGWLVYRRFRVESELLNLWWSIKYEDILFEDDMANEAMGCDGKRSMSSLAISNESFNMVPAADACNGSQQACKRQASPQLQPATPLRDSQQEAAAGSPVGVTRCEQTPGGLSVCHSLGLEAVALSSAHSGSSLSVGAMSTSGPQPATMSTGASQAQKSITGATKLLPLLNNNKSQASKTSGKQQNKPTPSSSKAKAPVAAAGSNNKDPSISSQNKNIKLKLGTVLHGGRDQSMPTKVGMYKASRVAVKHLNIKNLNINRQLLIELRQVRDLTHENLIKFIGLSPDEPNIALVSELCTRGNLQDLLQNDTIRLDWPFRFSIINDIVDGLIHLHSSPIQFHGRLKSSNCVIDNRFVVKLTDFGLPSLLAAVELEEQVNPRLLLWTAPEHLRTKHPLLAGSQKGDVYSLAIIFQEIITRCGPFECEPILCGASQVTTAQVAGAEWSAVGPPLLRTTDTGGHERTFNAHGAAHLYAHHQRRGGVSGAGTGHQPRANQRQQQQPMMMMQPVLVQHKQRLEPEEIVNLVRMGLSPPFRPYFRPDVASAASGTNTCGGGGQHQTAGDSFNVGDLIAMVQSCWLEAPAQRPSVASVRQQIKKMRHGYHLGGANLMDNLLQRMERYTDNLESLVEQKTAELMEEKKRSEELLYEMLPRFVVDQLKYGHSVTPEAYEAVTISFSDIKDFTSIAAQSSPIEVVNLLNQLYTNFDDCIAQYDVYKVETIGDAYMVVSGLPVRNGDQHAREIADMSLALLDLIRNFHVAHLPQVRLELRIGIHSGPCASGVVGTRMFRYCLFGDTVNTASRMESHGEPMKIHTSEDSANILTRFGNFIIEPRGQIEIKGKGLMRTYWLTGKRLA